MTALRLASKIEDNPQERLQELITEHQGIITTYFGRFEVPLATQPWLFCHTNLKAATQFLGVLEEMSDLLMVLPGNEIEVEGITASLAKVQAAQDTLRHELDNGA